MRYRRSDGTAFVLAHHSAQGWAEVMLTRLLKLGCSAEYANRIANSYHFAERA